MIVEDQAIIGDDLKFLLQDFGYDSCLMASTEEAVTHLEGVKPKPDLILMDVCVKKNIDGIDAARIIQERVKIPILFLTAYSREHIYKEIDGLFCCRHLQKPFSVQGLKECIEKLLAEAKRRPAGFIDNFAGNHLSTESSRQ